jgi:hypothetical protein
MTCAYPGYFSDMSDAPDRDLQPDRTLPRCTRCHRPSDVLVEDERGLGVDAWTGRWRTA